MGLSGSWPGPSEADLMAENARLHRAALRSRDEIFQEALGFAKSRKKAAMREKFLD